MSPLRLAVAGAAGRMGREVLRLATADPGRYAPVAAWIAPGSDLLDCDVSEWIGPGYAGLTGTLIAALDADVVVDFSTAAAVPEVARAAAASKAALVSGVTGLDTTAQAAFTAAARQVPVLHADNFSVGVAVLRELAVLARERLGGDFDVEIAEAHHRGKRDAPSGTALMLGRALGDSKARIRTGARENGDIGYSVRRGGQIAGEHSIWFLGPHESLELKHRAEDRSLFAAGALSVAEWLVHQPPGQYRIEDYLAHASD